tara:strand:- start:34835 stop:35467 length:633 start_codon:yes stop_codon:yes gene_type:complete
MESIEDIKRSLKSTYGESVTIERPDLHTREEWLEHARLLEEQKSEYTPSEYYILKEDSLREMVGSMADNEADEDFITHIPGHPIIWGRDSKLYMINWLMGKEIPSSTYFPMQQEPYLMEKIGTSGLRESTKRDLQKLIEEEGLICYAANYLDMDGNGEIIIHHLDGGSHDALTLFDRVLALGGNNYIRFSLRYKNEYVSYYERRWTLITF